MRKEIPMTDITKFNREDACTYSYDKFLAHMLPDSDVEKFRKFCNDHYTVFDHEDGIWEVTQKGNSKATGMEFLLERFSIPKENSYHGYLLLENGAFIWKDFDGTVRGTCQIAE